MAIPTGQQLAEWRRLAEDTMMISAVGEYTPAEFTVLLDAVDELQVQLAALEVVQKSAQANYEREKQSKAHLMMAVELALGNWNNVKSRDYLRTALEECRTG